MNTAEQIAVSSMLIAVACWYIYQRSLSLELRLARRETSRFPLFAARCHLVRLVAEGRMVEDDPAWQSLYGSVTSLLGLHQSLNRLDLISRYMKFLAALHDDPKLKEGFEKSKKREEEAAARVPEFAAVRSEAYEAFRHLVRRRTTRLHHTAVFLIFILAKLALLTIHAGFGTARFVGRHLLKEPSADDLRASSMADFDGLAYR